MTDVSNLDNLAAAIPTSSAKIRNYAIAQATATQKQEADFQAKITALDARLDALEGAAAYLVEEFNSVPGIWSDYPSDAYPTYIKTGSNGESGTAVRLITTPTSGPGGYEIAALSVSDQNLVHSGQGEETWYRVRMRFPTGAYFPTVGEWNWVLEWHHDVHTDNYNVQYSTGLTVANNANDACLMFRPIGGLSTSAVSDHFYLPSGSLQYNHWYDLVFRFVWKTAVTGGGWIWWWVDGVKYADKSFPILNHNPDGTVDHPSFGLYNYRQHANTTSEVQFDRVVIGPTALSVGFTP